MICSKIWMEKGYTLLIICCWADIWTGGDDGLPRIPFISAWKGSFQSLGEDWFVACFQALSPVDMKQNHQNMSDKYWTIKQSNKILQFTTIKYQMVHDFSENTKNMATLTWSARRRIVSAISAESLDYFRFKSHNMVESCDNPKFVNEHSFFAIKRPKSKKKQGLLL